MNLTNEAKRALYEAVSYGMARDRMRDDAKKKRDDAMRLDMEAADVADQYVEAVHKLANLWSWERPDIYPTAEAALSDARAEIERKVAEARAAQL